jgi:hypothetical protein
LAGLEGTTIAKLGSPRRFSDVNKLRALHLRSAATIPQASDSLHAQEYLMTVTNISWGAVAFHVYLVGAVYKMLAVMYKILEVDVVLSCVIGRQFAVC